jgi:hypothetical protein
MVCAVFEVTENVKVDLSLRLNFVCFRKVGLLYSRVEAGVASKF